MQTTVQILLPPGEAFHTQHIKSALASATSFSKKQITGWQVLRRSVDARGRTPMYQLRCLVYIDEPVMEPIPLQFTYQNVSEAKPVIVIGVGPAGLFAALRLIELGLKPIILERGKDVRNRRRDLAMITKQGEVNENSNYCFGEGGAGTYSDGKLYTRSSKRGSVERILYRLVEHGADANILIDAHPHIGTNKLPKLVQALSDKIRNCGGEIYFDKQVTDFLIAQNSMKGVVCADGSSYEASAVLLATGHSARDIFQLLVKKNILVQPKPFALGVRMEHPQAIIDTQQYHAAVRNVNLPPASYSIVQQVNERGVFSFCMCPGGIIAPAATAANEIVVNGWSPSLRNNRFANSGYVVQVEEHDWKHFNKNDNNPLAALNFQQEVEQKCFTAGGGKLIAPAQRLLDFATGKASASLPDCSYHPGIKPYNLMEVLPPFIAHSLKQSLLQLSKRMKLFYTNEAVLVATESRTSSPVKIPRDKTTFQHPEIAGLFPCGEGAGYAGGIMSAAMDGENCANAISQWLQ